MIFASDAVVDDITAGFVDDILAQFPHFSILFRTNRFDPLDMRSQLRYVNDRTDWFNHFSITAPYIYLDAQGTQQHLSGRIILFKNRRDFWGVCVEILKKEPSDVRIESNE
jgi:hypothetical protein